MPKGLDPEEKGVGGRAQKAHLGSIDHAQVPFADSAIVPCLLSWSLNSRKA